MSERFYDSGPPSNGGRKVMLATTVYDKPSAAYAHALGCSRQALDIPHAYLLLQGNCHVDDARNAVVRDFLQSDCTELVFLDADVSWQPEALIALLGYDVDIVGGVYPYRRETQIDHLPVRALPDARMQGGLIEVDGLPTGFLRIKRHVLDKMVEVAPKFLDREDNPLTPLLFDRDTLGDGRRSGDIRFCMKWREMGGKLYAAYDLRLSHSGSWTVADSFGAFLRRSAGDTLSYMVRQIKAGKADLDLFKEIRRYVLNPFAATEDVMLTVVLQAAKSDGPILEIGSGVSTIALAAATDETVWCIEHDPVWALKLEQMAAHAGVSNIAICTQPIRVGWYDLSDIELPERFGLAFCDGPPRHLASRMPFFARLGARCDVIVADDGDDMGYRTAVNKWADGAGYEMTMVGNRAIHLKRRADNVTSLMESA